MPDVSDQPVGVIGGGITGLSAAFELMRTGRRVVLFERSSSLGGKIAETTIDGTAIPTGPDAFLARRPEVSELAELLGLGDSLVSPVARQARIFRNGELHELPPNVLGVPASTDFGDSGLISVEGARIAEEGVADAPQRAGVDESVGALVRRQLGDEVLEFLVDPLLGGINAGDSDRLSIIAGVPQLDALRKRNPRLLDAAAAAVSQAQHVADSDDPSPVFHSINGGLRRLVERLVDVLEASELVTILTNIEPRLCRAGDGWRIDTDDASIAVASVISTIPAAATAQLIEAVSPEGTELVGAIEYSSVALTIMVLAPGTIPLDASISGVLVPRSLGLSVTAVSFASHKWPELAVGGRQVLRVSVGRRTHTSWTALDDSELVEVIERDLSEIFGVEVNATSASVHRWMNALPQYDVGHLERIARIDALTDLDGVHLTGAWRDGLGLPACVGAGRAGARAV